MYIEMKDRIKAKEARKNSRSAATKLSSRSTATKITQPQLKRREIKREQIAELLQIGRTSSEIIRQVGGSINTVTKVKRELGIELKPYTRKTTEAKPTDSIASSISDVNVVINASDKVSIQTTISGSLTTITITIQDNKKGNI
jgi:hypothetical protein